MKPPDKVNLAPADRSLARELAERGPGGMDYLELRSRGLLPMADHLVAAGQARRLAQGRVVGTDAFATFAAMLAETLRHREELHIRDLADRFDLSRGAARALLTALVEEGLLENHGPTVYGLAEAERKR